MMLNDYIVTEDTPLIETMKKIDTNACGNVFVCKSGILLGVATDGDVRRSIMNGIDMSTPISEIANYKPIFLYRKDEHKAIAVMQEKVITALPIVDNKRCLIDIKFLLKGIVSHVPQIDIPVVIMAGGKGTRLKPYTDILPKPLIPIGDKTITEHIMDHFQRYGCMRFHMIVNYKKNFIKSYFTDNFIDNNTKTNILFTEEEEFLGTGGGLTLVREDIKETFFLTNCDILVEADYAELMERHKEQKNIITIVCAKKNVVIPYGTVEISKDGYVEKFREKPSFEFNTNTGLYVIDPKFLEKIPRNTFINITDVIAECIADGENVGTYLIDDEDWTDMGQLEELEKMKEKIGL